jgi:isoleucyl-tRNA synthetase
MNFTIKPNFKTVGSRLGAKMRLYQEALLKLDQTSIDNLLKGNTITIDLDGENIEVTEDMIDIRIESKPGFNVGMENNNFIILNTELTDDLMLEGHAREIVSKVQNMRKDQGFDIADRIKLYYSGDEELLKAFNIFADYIKDETLSVEYLENKTDNEVDINGHTATIQIEKVIK